MKQLLFIATVFIAAVASAEPLVGVYYYPWYGQFSGGHGFSDTARYQLSPQQPPAIGFYDSRAEATITAHIDQSHRGNIRFWAVSWWGPDSAENVTLQKYILAHPRANELKYCVLYESTARLGTFANPDFSKLLPDFQYMAQNIFNNANYLKIDSRPVVYIYLTRAYFNTEAGRDSIANLKQAMQTEFGYVPYLVGDDLFGSSPVDVTRAKLWDSVTDYDVYGTVLQSHGSTRKAIDTLKSQFESWKSSANSIGAGFVPAATPGFDDRAVRKGHVAAPRNLPDKEEGSLFDSMLEQAALSTVDSRANEMLIITSFNEWHEDTQIEPTVAAGYGNLYLDILARRTKKPK